MKGAFVMSEEFVAEIDPRVILDTVCKTLGLKKSRVLGTRHLPCLVDARFIIAHLSRKHSDWQLIRIAKMMKRVNHTAVMHSLKRYEELFFSCAEFRNKVDQVKHTLREKGYDC